MRLAVPPLARSLLALLALAACSPVPAPGRAAQAADAAPIAAATEVAEPAEVADDAGHGRHRLDAEAAAWVETTLASLTLRQRVAQLVMPWISGEPAAANPAEHARMLEWVAADEVGGLIVSRGTPAALAAKLNAAQARAAVPLLIVSDLETGPGMRLTGGTEIAPAMAFGAAGDTALAREAGQVTGLEARAVGIHMTLGPVLDVNSNPRNPIINVRSFGEEPAAVAALANAWMEGAREAGLLSVGKHFPGHGDTEVDSHVGLSVIPGDRARLDAVELVPFARAMEAGMAGVLVGHIAMQGLEGRAAPPASLSPRVIGGLLRREMGFEGLVITDALNMGAITRGYPVAEASVLALAAGADVLLQPPGTRAVIDHVVAAVEAGRLPRERIDDAARRVLTAKAAVGAHRGAAVDAGALGLRVATAAHLQVARRVAEASVTLVRDTGGLVPIAAGGSVLHVGHAASGRGGAGHAMSEALRLGGVRVEHVRVDDRTTRAQFEALRARAAAASLVIATAAVAPHQYRALALDDEFGRFVESLAAAGQPVVAVSFGSPYLLESFPSVPTYLVGWSNAEESQRAVARALLGRIPVRGRLPVSVPPLHGRGEGVTR